SVGRAVAANVRREHPLDEIALGEALEIRLVLPAHAEELVEDLEAQRFDRVVRRRSLPRSLPLRLLPSLGSKLSEAGRAEPGGLVGAGPDDLLRDLCAGGRALHGVEAEHDRRDRVVRAEGHVAAHHVGGVRVESRLTLGRELRGRRLDHLDGLALDDRRRAETLAAEGADHRGGLGVARPAVDGVEPPQELPAGLRGEAERHRTPRQGGAQEEQAPVGPVTDRAAPGGALERWGSDAQQLVGSSDEGEATLPGRTGRGHRSPLQQTWPAWRSARSRALKPIRYSSASRRSL